VLSEHWVAVSTAATSGRAAISPTWRRATGLFGLAWFVLFAAGGIALQGEPLPYDTPIGEARDFSPITERATFGATTSPV
jgi:hypothetical protein